MKTLKESLEDELICGLNLFEKLKINKGKNTNVKIPTVDIDNSVVHTNKIWKEFKLPIERFLIYKDKYRGNIPHLSSLDDFIYELMLFQDDYEDFDITKDIIYTSNDEKDIVEWYIKEFLKLDLPERNDDEDAADWVNSTPNNLQRICDNLGFLYNTYLGYDHISEDDTLDIYNIKELSNSFADMMGFDIK